MEPKTKQKAKGSWGIRFFIVLLGIALGLLFYWILSFVEQDLGRLKGPDHNAIRRQYVAQSLDDRKETLEKDIAHFNRRIEVLNEQLGNLKKDTTTLQNTLNQLLSIQQQSIEKGVEFPEKSRQTLQEAQSAFLDNQTRNQEFNKQISDLTLTRQEKQAELTDLNEQIKTLEKDFYEEFNKLSEKHRWKVAAMKLALLLPIFLAASVVFMKYRTSAYWPLVWAVFIASFIKVAVVSHRYMPPLYFKYIAVLVLLAVVLRLLVYLIKMIVAPKKDLLIKQYQQLYDKCLCPVCTKPIRTGPLRYIGGMKKKTPIQVGGSENLTAQQSYTCPSCGTGLYHKCDNCGNIRHTLLPYCEHCGSENKTEEM